MAEIGFAIIIPTFNQLAYLKKCLNSVLGLNYEKYEVILHYKRSDKK